ncbi:hypothetical protein [Burkholderia theae]|uniref:hypothetical protein n=1 Tax=Burkholderia theae TaxID=3143496 RepID=UPI0039F44D3A
MLPLLGLALNGTSSVLYGTVPDQVDARKREQAFAMFYTSTIGAGTLSPVLFGRIGETSRVC